MARKTLTRVDDENRWKPHRYQEKALKFLLQHASAGLFLDPGLGKTSIALGALNILFKKKMINRVLLVAPVRVCHSVWPREIEKWADFNHLTYVILHGPDKEELLKKDVNIYLINAEGLDWLLDTTKTASATNSKKKRVTVNVARLKKLGFDVLIIDEISKFKHVNTGRFKAIKQILHMFKIRWGLTGSPASNGLMDLFGIMYVIDQGRSLGEFITKFRATYFTPKDKAGFTWIINKGSDELIYERIAPVAMSMKAEDYLELPELIYNNIRIDLPEDVMEIYLQMQELLIADIKNNIVVAATAATASMKCRQIASGGIYLTPEVLETGLLQPRSGKRREWIDLHTEKVDALEELVEELSGSPLLVAYDFEHDVARLRKRFPEAVYACDLTAKEFSLVERKWNNGEIPLLFGHPGSIGHGLNLQECGNNVCFHSMIWDFELYDQLIRRVYRQGNTSKKVFVHHMLARGTVDELVMYAMKRKDKTQRGLFQGLKDLAKKK